MQKSGFSLFKMLIVACLFSGCNSCCDSRRTSEEKLSETVAIHNPIYPKSETPVNFSLFLVNDALPKEVKLTVFVRELQTDLTWSEEVEVYSETWTDPVNFPLTKNITGGFISNSLVTYNYEVKCNDAVSSVYKHQVTFATNPYPFSTIGTDSENEPAPVYVTAEVSQACNVVFIPDMDLVNVVVRTGAEWQDYFYNTVRDNIKNGIFNDPETRKNRIGFNFFINPVSGNASPENGAPFIQPANYLKLDFAAGKCFIHNAEFTEYASESPLMKCYTSRIYNRGSFMHESGHVLFLLADEYEFGKHWYDAANPNNWRSESEARSAALSFGLKDEHVFYLDEPYASEKCYILCPYEGCQMGLAGLSPVNYCKPCIKAVDYWMTVYKSP